MKKIFTSVLLLTCLALTTETFATNHIVTAKNYVFTPNNFNCIVGDTVTWKWVDNVHEPESKTIPVGAAPWNHEITPTDSLFSYVVTVPGVYNYDCLFHSVDGMTGQFTASAPTGITGVQEDKPIKVFPSPFHNRLTIDLSNSTTFKSEVTIEVTNGIGEKKLVMNSTEILNNAVTLETGDLAPGIYFVSLSDGINKKTYRVIKAE